MENIHAKLTDTYMLLPLDSSGIINCELTELEEELTKRVRNNPTLRQAVGDNVADKLYLSIGLGIAEPFRQYNHRTNPYIANITVDIGVERQPITFIYESPFVEIDVDDSLNYIPAVIATEWIPPYSYAFESTVLLYAFNLIEFTRTDPKTLLPTDANITSVERLILDSLREPIKIRLR